MFTRFSMLPFLLICAACSPTSPQVVTSTKFEVAFPPTALTTPCTKTPVRFNTAGDLVDAYQTRDGDFDVCAAKVKGVRDWVQKSDPKVIPAPVPPARPFSFRRKPKKVTS